MPDILTVFFLTLTMIVNKTFTRKISYTLNEPLLKNKYNVLILRVKDFNKSLTHPRLIDISLQPNPLAMPDIVLKAFSLPYGCRY